MCWYEFLITFLLDLLSGVMVAFLASVFIDNKFRKRENEKYKLNEYYLFFENLKNKKVCEIENLEQKLKEIENFLEVKKFKKNNLYNLFEIVYKDITAILRFHNGEQIIISDANVDLQEFLLLLKNYIR